MNTYIEILNRLNSKTRTRSLLNDVEPSVINKIITNMNAVLQEKLEQKEMEKQQRQAKMEIITNLKKTLQDNGLSLSDLHGLDSESPQISMRKLTKDKYTFQYMTLSGDAVFWYGTTAGRLPKAFQDYLERTGKKRRDCIVNND